MNTHLFIPALSAGLLLTLPVAAQQDFTAPAPVPAPVDPALGGMAPIAPSPAASFVPGRVIAMRPEQKRPLLLKESERNPYARRSTEQVEAAEEQATSEEIRLREKLSSLRVTGSSLGPRGLRVLMGDIILEKGRDLPQLITDQTVTLNVIELTEDAVVLGWVETETGKATGKTMQFAYDLSPSVGYALQGQERSNHPENAGADRVMGVLRVGQERKRQEAGMAARAPENVVPPEVFQAGQ